MASAVLLCLVHLLNLVEFFSACKGCLLTEATPPKKRRKVTVYIYVPYTREAFSFFFFAFLVFFWSHTYWCDSSPPTCVCVQPGEEAYGRCRTARGKRRRVHPQSHRQATNRSPPTHRAARRGEGKGRGGGVEGQTPVFPVGRISWDPFSPSPPPFERGPPPPRPPPLPLPLLSLRSEVEARGKERKKRWGGVGERKGGRGEKPSRDNNSQHPGRSQEGKTFTVGSILHEGKEIFLPSCCLILLASTQSFQVSNW